MKVIFLLTIFIFIHSTSYSQINLDEQIKSRILASPMLQSVGTTVNQGILGPARLVTDKFYRFVSLEYSVDAGDVNIMSQKMVKLPTTKSENVYSNTNCTSFKRGWTRQVTVKQSTSQTAKISNTFTNNASKTVGFDLKISFPIPIADNAGSIAGSSSISKTVSFGNSSTDEKQWSHTDEETTNETINFDVDPFTKLYAKFVTTVFTLRVPFKANLTVSGFVNLVYVAKLRWSPGENIPGTETILGHDRVPIQSILLNDSQRTFEITGFLESSKSIEQDVLYSEKKLTPSDCTDFPTQATMTPNTSFIRDAVSSIDGGQRTEKNFKIILKNLRNDKRISLESEGSKVDSSSGELKEIKFRKAIRRRGVVTNFKSNMWQAVCETVELPLCIHSGTWYGPERELKSEAQKDADNHKGKCSAHDPSIINW